MIHQLKDFISKPIYSKFKLIALITLSSVMFPQISHFYTFVAREALTPNPILKQDEGVSYNAVTGLLEKGYFKYQCTEGASGICYGGVQVAIDALLLALTPEGSGESGPLLRTPGKFWPWTGRSILEVQVLRGSRLVYALMFPLLLLFALRKIDLKLGLLLAVVCASSPVFISGWAGYKNDYASLFWVYLFCQFSVHALHSDHCHRKRLQWFAITLLVGLLGTLVRPSLLLGLFLLTAYYTFYELIVLKTKLTFKHFGFAAALALALGAIFVFFSPGFLNSSRESRVVLDYIGIGAGITYKYEYFIQELQFTSWHIWFLVALVSGFVIERKLKLRENHHHASIFLILFFTIATFFVTKTFFNRLFYYLFPVSIGFSSIIYFARHNRYFRETTFWLALIGAFAHGGATRFERGIGPTYFTDNTQTFPIFGQPDTSYLTAFDIAIRPALLKQRWQNKAVFFDSVTQTPEDVYKLFYPRVKKVVVACWDPNEYFEEAKEMRRSTAAEMWLELTKKHCSHFARFDFGYRPYAEGSAATVFTTLEIEELKNHFGPLVLSDVTNISPRGLTGATMAMDDWIWPLVTNQPLKLEGKWTFNQPKSKILLDIETSCKGNMALTTSIESMPNLNQSIDTVLDITPILPSHLSRPPLIWWSKRKLKLKPIELKFNTIPALQPMIFKFDLHGQSNHCVTAITKIRVL